MSKPGDFMLEHALKAAQWERAKGELRALVAMQGSHVPGPPGMGETPEYQKWQHLRHYVEGFIKNIEDRELQL